MVVPKSVCLIEQGQTNGHSRVRLIVELQRVYPAFNRPRRIRGKIFVTVPPDEEHVHIFVGDDDRDPALALHPEFLEKLIWGGKVRGLRVRLSKASPSVVNQLRRAAWVRKAPRRLVAASMEQTP